MPSDAFLRIKDLCRDGWNPESELISQLESLLETNPGVQCEKDEHDCTLLHFAARIRSVEFIKLLVESDGGLESVRATNHFSCLPIHLACFRNVKVVKYLLSIYPEGINVAGHSGCYPLHYAVDGFLSSETDDDLKDLVRFLLTNDQGAVSKLTMEGGLALHMACWKPLPLEIFKLVYNKYPQAIHARDDRGEHPLFYAKGDRRTFLEAQLEWERQALEETQPDEQGQLPIHRFLHESPDVHVGTVELMISANPGSATARDNVGFNPLHYACKFGQLDVVKYLLDSNEDSIKEVDLSGELPLHIACREGRCSVINCILDKSSHGVSSRNEDGKLPLELLLLCEHDIDRDSLRYVEAMNRLLRSHPNVLECLVANDGNKNGEGILGDSLSCALKRKHRSI